jgi:SAM-dependent methyltransferase
MAVTEGREIERERAVQGAAWDSVHLGYFSDPETAVPLVEAVLETASRTRPDLIADIGGGTGFILGELARRGIDPGVKLLNLDLSPAQLAAGRHPRVRGVKGAVGDLRREQLLPGAGSILFIKRSVLHYLGPKGLVLALRHIRSQMEPGEYFIHQTACFDDDRAAACLNAVYAGLGTEKRYPPAATLAGFLVKTGFSVFSQRPCPALTLTSGDLGRRYNLDRATMAAIGRRVGERFGNLEGVFREGPEGFTARLHYRVFITRAD